jgi:hypothetical protein
MAGALRRDLVKLLSALSKKLHKKELNKKAAQQIIATYQSHIKEGSKNVSYLFALFAPLERPCLGLLARKNS